MPGDTGEGGTGRGDDAKPRRRASPADPVAGDRDTGAALRSVYQATVDETVPDEMLDLLGRLD